MKKTMLVIIASLLSLVLVAGCAGQTKNQASLGEEFTLPFGQTVSIKNENFDIKFTKVISDSRCPQGVTCIWAGEVSCLIDVTQGSEPTFQVVLTVSGGADQASQTINGYDFTYKVQPYPVSGTTLTDKDYKLVMTIDKNTQPGIAISPAPIQSISVATTLSQPPEVVVDIKVGLKDSCTSINNVLRTRDANTITLTVNNQTLTGQFCAQIYTYVDRWENLGSDFVTGQTYTIKVNDQTTTFTMP